MSSRFGPVPPNFRKTFTRLGWRGAERYYGVSSPTITKWIIMAGGMSLHAERAKAQRCGRRSGTVNAAGVGE